MKTRQTETMQAKNQKKPKPKKHPRATNEKPERKGETGHEGCGGGLEFDGVRLRNHLADRGALFVFYRCLSFFFWGGVVVLLFSALFWGFGQIFFVLSVLGLFCTLFFFLKNIFLFGEGRFCGVVVFSF